jgi:arsenite-transporting ATPase
VFPSGGDNWRSGWARSQQAQLGAIRESFAGLPVREIAYGDREPVGSVALAGIAAQLYGDADPGALPPQRELMRVETEGAEHVLVMFLPLATRGGVDAARAGDDLVVTVGGHRRVLTLPSVLRRCEVTGGQYRDGELRVRFAASNGADNRA